MAAMAMVMNVALATFLAPLVIAMVLVVTLRQGNPSLWRRQKMRGEKKQTPRSNGCMMLKDNNLASNLSNQSWFWYKSGFRVPGWRLAEFCHRAVIGRYHWGPLPQRCGRQSSNWGGYHALVKTEMEDDWLCHIMHVCVYAYINKEICICIYIYK